MRNLWKSGVCETGGGGWRWQAPREADSDMQLGRVNLETAEQSILAGSNCILYRSAKYSKG